MALDDLTRVLVGAAAGAVATFVMGKATTAMYQREDPAARRREDRLRGGKTAYGVAAERAAGLAGRDIDEEQRERYGKALHWATGVGAGAVYGALAGRRPQRRLSILQGAAFGGAFFLLVDELANTALGLTPDPRRFPWQTHARGLAGHVVFGLTAELALRLAEGGMERAGLLEAAD